MTVTSVRRRSWLAAAVALGVMLHAFDAHASGTTVPPYAAPREAERAFGLRHPFAGIGVAVDLPGRYLSAHVGFLDTWCGVVSVDVGQEFGSWSPVLRDALDLLYVMAGMRVGVGRVFGATPSTYVLVAAVYEMPSQAFEAMLHAARYFPFTFNLWIGAQIFAENVQVHPHQWTVGVSMLWDVVH